MNNQLPHDTIVPFKDSALTKKQQVATMFDNIAYRYDFMNRFLSAGVDVYWRKRALRELKNTRLNTVLDVATGTADMAILTHKILAPGSITGIDLSEGMLEVGRKKINKLGLSKSIRLIQGDSEKLMFADNSFDAITVAFGVRNYEQLYQGLTEMLRVLKPGGKLVVLEFSKPGKGFKVFYDLYMKYVAPGLGKIVSNNRDAYQYLNDSVKAFPEGKDFLNILQSVGYKKTYLKSMTFGISTIYCGYK
jgi:demethylmenaquinone methyltransferase/2-methoxy-6-polyprenyl-1,4-benzoquinol methylase